MGVKEWVTKFKTKKNENSFFPEIGKLGMGGDAKQKFILRCLRFQKIIKFVIIKGVLWVYYLLMQKLVNVH